MPRQKNHPGMPLTNRQTEVFTFLVEYFWDNHQLPPCRTIAQHFGFASDNAAQDHLDMLESKGKIEKNANGKWKFVDLDDVI